MSRTIVRSTRWSRWVLIGKRCCASWGWWIGASINGARRRSASRLHIEASAKTGGCRLLTAIGACSRVMRGGGMAQRFRWSTGATMALCWMLHEGNGWAGQNAEGGLNSGGIAWILASSALVMGMIIPGLAFYYGGLVRSKNVISTMIQSFSILCVVSLVWVVCGFTLAFGPDRGGVIGALDWGFLTDVGAAPHPVYAPAVPLEAFVLVHLLFPACTPAWIARAFAELINVCPLLL